MIEAVIRWSVANRVLVLMVTLLVVLGGVVALRSTPIDAIPDLSDVQVIVKTRYPGQAPQVVEDQVTYPLTTAMLSVPGATTVRGYSFFGDSYVYVIFEDGTDLYWARSRVLESLSQAAASLPDGVEPELGPDATGVGWVYLYALVDSSGQHDLGELRSLQDWYLKYELQMLPGVSEVAAVGGMVRQYQVVVDPDKLRAYNMPLAHIETAIARGNLEAGASVVEMAEAEYMVLVSGYLQSEEHLRDLPLGVNARGTPLRLADVAEVRLGPQMRRGVAELNGEGEVVGGIVVMRSGANAKTTIDGVKQRLEQLRSGLPPGVEIVTVYDRSALIDRAVANVQDSLLAELAIVALVCAAFLFHLRSSLVAIVSLPVGILAAFIVMRIQGINANIMSLGGIAIAVGAMVDGAIVLVENLHKKIEATPLTPANRWQLVTEAAEEVGPSLFFSLLVITVSFFPVFALEAQEGRMFTPLAFTKTYAMAASAILTVTLIPVLMGYLIRGGVRPEQKNPLNRLLTRHYRPLLAWVLHRPAITLAVALLLLLTALWPLSQMGQEFMPELDEGDLMYMPTTHPGISIGKARQLLQQTDKLIRTVPEVKTVFGKVGRADTATDPAPLTMIETFVQLNDRSTWRDGLTPDDLRRELNDLVSLPGLTNAWVMPIKTRIDMLATGIKTPVGIKVAGPDLDVIQSVGEQLEKVLLEVPGTASVYSERVAGGRYLKIDIDRDRAARYGLNIADIQQVISTAVGGREVSRTVEGRERYPINLRYPQSTRESPEALAGLPIVTSGGLQIVLGDVADIRVADGPPGIKSENSRLTGWIYVDIRDVDVGHYVASAREVVSRELDLPAGYSLQWSGQYEYMERAGEKLTYVVPLTLMIIALLLFMNFRSGLSVLLVMTALPFSLIGSLWLMHWQAFNFSIAVGVGFIALAGVAVETSVIMLSYLDRAWRDACSQGGGTSDEELREAIMASATARVRPVMMTAATVIIGLVPLLFATGTGSEIMSRIAAPMVGGMFSTVVMTLLVLPVAFYWIKRGGGAGW